MQLTSGSLFSIYQKGRLARRTGLRKSACPYEDKRGSYRNMVTFSTACINYWNDGWSDEDAKNPDRYAARPCGTAESERPGA